MSVQRSTLIFARILLLPALLYVTVIVAHPLVDTFILSFTDASLKTTNWVGLGELQQDFQSTPSFRSSSGPFILTFFSVSIKMIIGTFGAAMLIAAVPGRALFRISTMPPWIVPMAIGIFMWGWMYNGQFGMISGMLQRMGFADGPVAFLAYGKHGFLGDDHHRRGVDWRADGHALYACRHAIGAAGSRLKPHDGWAGLLRPLPPHHAAASRSVDGNDVDAVPDLDVRPFDIIWIPDARRTEW